MNYLIPDNILQMVVNRPRVCLPYGLDIFDLARWFGRASNTKTFDLVYGGQKDSWQGLDILDLFIAMREKCINYNLANAYVSSSEDGSMYFFDMHERFSFFSADRSLLERVYPFSRDIVWENFALLQEEDVDFSLREIFEFVHSC